MFRLPYRRCFGHTASPPRTRISRSRGYPFNKTWNRLALGVDAPSEKATGAYAKSTVEPEKDLFEREAEQTADRVMRMSESEAESTGTDAARTRGPENRAAEIQGEGEPLSTSDRQYFEPRFAADLSHIRVHADAEGFDFARRANARAFTYGKDIVFKRDEYRPGTQSGRRLLAHELSHTFQQGASDISPRAGLDLSRHPGGHALQGDFLGSLGRGWNMYWGMNDEGAYYARQLMEWRMIGFGSDFEPYDYSWNVFMRDRPEIQRAMAVKFRSLAQTLASGKPGSGAFSASVTGVRLNELESMRLTLHGCHRIDIEGDYEVTEQGTEKTVRFSNVRFTWVDRADLHPGTETELESGERVDDREFTSAGWDYDIRIHFDMPRSSTWKVTPEEVRHERGWPPVTGAPAAGFRG